MRFLLGVAVPNLFVAPEGVDITRLREVTPDHQRFASARSPQIDRQVLDNYRANLQSMAGLIKKSKAVGVFCTIPVNLSGWAPQNVPPTTSMDWQQMKQEAFSLYQLNRYADAAGLLEQLNGIASGYALGHYLLGDSYRHLGLSLKAQKEYRLACDLDPTPLRATSSFQKVVRDMATSEKMHLLDLEKEFAQFSGKELVGLDLFVDHVHLSETGHRLAAIKALAAIKGIDSSLPEGHLEQLIWQDRWSALQQKDIIDLMFVRGMTFFNNGDLARAEQTFLQVLELAPDFPEPAGALGEIYEHRGDLVTALNRYRQAFQSNPGSPYTPRMIRLLYRQGDLATVCKVGDYLRSQSIPDAGLFVKMGDISSEQKDFSEALKMYQHAVVIGGMTTDLQTRINAVSLEMRTGS